jgi:hypothetical protein
MDFMSGMDRLSEAGFPLFELKHVLFVPQCD